MKPGPREICPHSPDIPLFGSRPSRPAIHTSTAYLCESPTEADERLAGTKPGFVYQRDGHPNAITLAEKCRILHGEKAAKAVVTSSGMSATTLALVSQLKSGDHVLLSNRLYGKTVVLVEHELTRFGIEFSVADFCDLENVAANIRSNTRMLVIETISNPKLRVINQTKLAELARSNGCLLLVDNTFASPIVCRPLDWGADLVVESLTKIMNGHGDITMGLLCGTDETWERVPSALASWGMTTGPFDCWLTERGVSTLYLRMSAAAKSAKQLATQFAQHKLVRDVAYPGLETHPDRGISESHFCSVEGETCFGNMITIEVANGIAGAARFMQAVEAIPYCPSLGELATTLSHPCSSSHRNLNDQQLAQLGISGGTIRLSIGLESPEYIAAAIEQSLSAV